MSNKEQLQPHSVKEAASRAFIQLTDRLLPKEYNQNPLPISTVVLRAVSSRLTELLFPGRIVDQHQTLTEFENWVRNNKPVIIAITHPSARDPIEAIRDLIFKIKTARYRPLKSPVAFHHYNSMFGRLANAYGGEILPIVTEETIKNQQNQGKKLGYGLKGYRRQTTQILISEGFVVIATQGTRMSSLEQKPRSRPIEFLLKDLVSSSDFRGVAILPVAIAIEGVQNYNSEETEGYNAGRRYTLHIGTLIKIEPGQPIEIIDGLVHQQHLTLAPKNYQPAV